MRASEMTPRQPLYGLAVSTLLYWPGARGCGGEECTAKESQRGRETYHVRGAQPCIPADHAHNTPQTRADVILLHFGVRLHSSTICAAWNIGLEARICNLKILWE